jgi:Flp pilus assembly pilin Flp
MTLYQILKKSFITVFLGMVFILAGLQYVDGWISFIWQGVSAAMAAYLSEKITGER